MIHQVIEKEASRDSVLAKVVWAPHTIDFLLLQMEDVYVFSTYKVWIHCPTQ